MRPGRLHALNPAPSQQRSPSSRSANPPRTTTEPISRYLDAAILTPETPRDRAVEALETRIGFGVYSVCVRSCDLEIATDLRASADTGDTGGCAGVLPGRISFSTPDL